MSTRSGVVYKKCHSCGKSQTDIKKCSRCNYALYCNRECQKNHWESHKQMCNRVSNGNLKIVTNQIGNMNVNDKKKEEKKEKDPKIYIPARDARELFKELEEEGEKTEDNMNDE